MLFIPCSRGEKYSARQAIDAFFVYTGDVMSAFLIFIGTTCLSLSVPGFAITNVVLVLGWLVLAIGVGRIYRALTESKALAASGDAP
jgi:AAA family ATP:ADP antiporter